MTDLPLARDGYELKYSALQFGAGFPALWAPSGNGLGGPPPGDAGTLHFTVATRHDELYEDGVTVAVTLKALVEDLVDGCQDREGVIDSESAVNVARISAAMREAADWMDSRLKIVSAKKSVQANKDA